MRAAKLTDMRVRILSAFGHSPKPQSTEGRAEDVLFGALPFIVPSLDEKLQLLAVPVPEQAVCVCPTCAGELESGRFDFFWELGVVSFYFPEVPSLVCSNCRSTWLTKVVHSLIADAVQSEAKRLRLADRLDVKVDSSQYLLRGGVPTLVTR